MDAPANCVNCVTEGLLQMKEFEICRGFTGRHIMLFSFLKPQRLQTDEIFYVLVNISITLNLVR